MSQVMTALATERIDDRARLRLWIRMIRTTRAIENRLRERLRLEFSETMPRFDVMAALYRNPEGINMSSLSRSLMVSNGNVTPLIERLVTSGMVLREHPPGDRRSQIVRLSAKGHDHFSRMATAHRNWVDELLGDLEPDEVNACNEQLGRIDLQHITGSAS